MREGPVLFCGEMIRKILSNDKTQTRRVVKFPEWFLFEYPRFGAHEVMAEIDCPYGAQGDRLWCRETFRETWDIDDRLVLEYRAGGTRLIQFDDRGHKIAAHGEHRITSVLPKWRPSIFMPRWASRITLEVCSVRVERVQEISEADAVAEGVGAYHRASEDGEPGCTVPARDRYAALWDSINGAKYPWASNPFVWCIAFRVLTPSADRMTEEGEVRR